jgi:protein-disulfide isomerase
MVALGYAVYVRLPLPPRVDKDEWALLIAGRVVDEAIRDAPTLVEFVDYQCPYCALSEATIFDGHGEQRPLVRRVIRYYPLPYHAQAKTAAAVAECTARLGGNFERLHSRLYRMQDSLSSADWIGLAVWAGVSDTTALQRCIAGSEVQALIERDIALGQAVGVAGTPTYFLDRRRLSPMSPVALRSLLRNP